MSCDTRLVAVDATNFDALPCCGIKCATHAGRLQKRAWLEANVKLGLRAKTLLAPDGTPCGYVEYLPGEHAWRGVKAAGYMFIHCVWMHSRRYQGRGWGSRMIEDCLADARSAGMLGVAALAREGPWAAANRLFLANGFEPVDSAPPDFQLLVRKLRRTAPNPSFQQDWDRKIARYGRGMTIIRSNQCPYLAKFTSEIAQTSSEEFGITPAIVELESARDAQDAPTPYAVFSIIYNGRLLADHQISRTRFRNIMTRLSKKQ